jgi:hypothetical protein
MAMFVPLSSGMMLNVDNISVIQVYRHDNGHVRHARVWMIGTAHHDAFELSQEDAELLITVLNETKQAVKPVEMDRQRR